MILDPAAEMGLTFLAAGGVEQELTFPVAAGALIKAITNGLPPLILPDITPICLAYEH